MLNKIWGYYLEGCRLIQESILYEANLYKIHSKKSKEDE
mgnify:FL=1